MVLQVYIQDEPELGTLARQIANYTSVPQSEFTKNYLESLTEHLSHITQPGGLFTDTAVSGGPWRGQQRRVRATLYRRRGHRARLDSLLEATVELNEVATKWTSALAAAGISVHRHTGAGFYQWLLPWFNPCPQGQSALGGQSTELAPYPGDEDLPFGADFAESLTLSMPRSDAETGTWWFDEIPHTVVSVQGLRRAPEIGHLTAERPIGEHVYALFDRMPEGTIMVMTLTVVAQDKVRNHLSQICRAAVGDSAEAMMTREDAVAVERQMAQGDKLYPVSLAFYLRAPDLKSLRVQSNHLHALLLPNGLQPISRESDLLVLDSYIRN